MGSGQRVVGRVFVCRKRQLVVRSGAAVLGREGRLTNLVTGRGSRTVSWTVDIAAERAKVGAKLVPGPASSD